MFCNVVAIRLVHNYVRCLHESHVNKIIIIIIEHIRPTLVALTQSHGSLSFAGNMHFLISSLKPDESLRPR